jgi:hypothetical protein
MTMSTLPLRTTLTSDAWVFPGFGRFGTFVSSLFDVLAEAQAVADKTQKQYPFVTY